MEKIYITLFLSFALYSIIYCEPSSSDQINTIFNSYQNNIEKKFEEAKKFLNNGTVTKFNIPFRLKLYSMKLDIYRMERIIEKLRKQETNVTKLINEYNENEESFLNAYRHLLRIREETNEFYLNTVRIIKKIFIAVIAFIILGGIIILLITLYITKYKYRDYNLLVEKDKKDKKNTYQIVEIFNNFLNFKKLK